jgi:hypothetical protein
MNCSRTIAVVLTVIYFSPLQQANALPDCEAWLNNQVPVGPGKFLTPTPGRLVTADMEQVTAAGVTIEPSRRMRAKDYPWNTISRSLYRHPMARRTSASPSFG